MRGLARHAEADQPFGARVVEVADDIALALKTLRRAVDRARRELGPQGRRVAVLRLAVVRDPGERCRVDGLEHALAAHAQQRGRLNGDGLHAKPLRHGGERARSMRERIALHVDVGKERGARRSPRTPDGVGEGLELDAGARSPLGQAADG